MLTETLKKPEVEAVDEDECEFCGGDGYVTVDEDDGEGHSMGGVGSRRCICRQSVDDYEQDEIND